MSLIFSQQTRLASRGVKAPTTRQRPALPKLPDIEAERKRVARLAGIREVIFGSQDGLISTLTIVAGVAATTSGRAGTSDNPLSCQISAWQTL